MKNLRVCWVSAGISSFMAGVLAGNIDRWIYIDIEDQHPDSMRFIKDCEMAIGKEIEILRSEQYHSVEDCVRAFGGFRNYQNGFAPCTNYLKKRVRKEWEAENMVDENGERVEITYIWGFDAKETLRAERTIEANPQANHEFPLIEKNLLKEAVHELFERMFDFPRPVMYRGEFFLTGGYPNNNCVGCIKGGYGYWNKIRVDFPEVFAKRAALERLVGRSILKEADGTPLYLDELDPNRGNMDLEIFPECSIMCYLL